MAISKAEQAYTILRARIMDGTYGPGHRLVIDQLSREHGISSGPWRESLRRLEAEGWVEMAPNIGALVRKFDTDSWQQSLRLLARLEGLATALGARHLTAQDIGRARELNAQMREALGNIDLIRFGRLNREFHQLLASQCGDERLIAMIHDEWTRLDMVRKSAFWYAPGRALASLAEHDGLLDLIEGAADLEMIETAARRHETNTLQAVADYDAQLAGEARAGSAF